eukprot:1967055-Rhodomonas_salina.1
METALGRSAPPHSTRSEAALGSGPLDPKPLHEKTEPVRHKGARPAKATRARREPVPIAVARNRRTVRQ